jgi:hypothetical protein
LGAHLAEKHPDKPIEVWATDEHRLGLKPIHRRVWAPIGERPIALGHHRYEWLYVTGFVAPASGETAWYLSNGIDKPFFAKLLAAFARQTGAGRDRIIVLQLDNAGWHGPENLPVPDGIKLVYQPPRGPELQPAERLPGWQQQFDIYGSRPSTKLSARERPSTRWEFHDGRASRLRRAKIGVQLC